MTLETGRLARQAGGAVLITVGDNVVLCTATAKEEPAPGQDFFPLSVDYREKTASVGKIPGGFFKREGRPTEKEILSSRLIDRPIRPMFPDGFFAKPKFYATYFRQIKKPKLMSLPVSVHRQLCLYQIFHSIFLLLK